jgi:hypothetical protein
MICTPAGIDLISRQVNYYYASNTHFTDAVRPVPLLHRLLLCCVVQLLSLSGGSMESPVMDTMMELDAANAYSIMSYMSIQVNAPT